MGCRVQIFMSDMDEYLQCTDHDWVERLPAMDLPGDFDQIAALVAAHREANP